MKIGDIVSLSELGEGDYFDYLDQVYEVVKVGNKTEVRLVGTYQQLRFDSRTKVCLVMHK